MKFDKGRKGRDHFVESSSEESRSALQLSQGDDAAAEFLKKEEAMQNQKFNGH